MGNKKQDRSGVGFTLVEILIVVAIIAILASVVLVGLGPTQRLGRDARRISDLKQIQNGLELYFNKCGSYPGSASGVANCTTGAVSSWANVQGALTNSSLALGIAQIPDDPSSPNHYMYGVNSTGNTYVLGAQLEDQGNAAMKQSLTGFPGGISAWSTGSGTCGAAGIYCTAL